MNMLKGKEHYFFEEQVSVFKVNQAYTTNSGSDETDTTNSGLDAQTNKTERLCLNYYLKINEN